jgi:demethylmenaquinone methyltransferase/2-methoxy-6-polyprenyl-1,4-benzoquinol methylase
MMQVGQQRAQAERIEWLAGEAEHLPLADASVDLLTVSFGLRNATHLERALAEALRVLKPGGTFVCLEFSTPAFWLAPLYNLYSFLVIPRLGAAIAREPMAYQYLVESIRRFPPQQGFADMMRAPGLPRTLGESVVRLACALLEPVPMKADRPPSLLARPARACWSGGRRYGRAR